MHVRVCTVCWLVAPWERVVVCRKVSHSIGTFHAQRDGSPGTVPLKFVGSPGGCPNRLHSFSYFFVIEDTEAGGGITATVEGCNNFYSCPTFNPLSIHLNTAPPGTPQPLINSINHKCIHCNLQYRYVCLLLVLSLLHNKRYNIIYKTFTPDITANASIHDIYYVPLFYITYNGPYVTNIQSIKADTSSSVLPNVKSIWLSRSQYKLPISAFAIVHAVIWIIQWAGRPLLWSTHSIVSSFCIVRDIGKCDEHCTEMQNRYKLMSLYAVYKQSMVFVLGDPATRLSTGTYDKTQL